MGEDQVSEDMIEARVAEAEAGYDVEQLKQRKRGRPGRDAEPMQVVAVRLTADEIAALDTVVEREHISRSEAIRRALAAFVARTSTPAPASTDSTRTTSSRQPTGLSGSSH